MMIKKLMAVLGLVMMVGGVEMSAAQVGQDVVVVNTLEDSESGCPDVCSLREAVAIVADGGTVMFAEGIDEPVMVSQPILIDRDMTIQGFEDRTVVLNAGSEDKLLIIRDAEVTLRHLTLFAGYAEDSGGAVENYGVLTVEDSMFSHNSSQGDGGAIYNAGTLVVRDSIFLKNDALNGGAVVSADTNNTTIERSVFTGNTAEQYGGAIFGDFGGFVVVNSSFEDNFALGGGAILMNGFLDRGIIANSTIVQNSAEFGGGVCNLDEDSLFMLLSTIVAENEADQFSDVCPLMTSGGHNLIGDSAGGRWIASDLLDRESGVNVLVNIDESLAVYERFPTFELSADSLAIGMGNCAGNTAAFIPALETDQRGVARKSPCDIGAYETESAAN